MNTGVVPSIQASRYLFLTLGSVLIFALCKVSCSQI